MQRDRQLVDQAVPALGLMPTLRRLINRGRLMPTLRGWTRRGKLMPPPRQPIIQQVAILLVPQSVKDDGPHFPVEKLQGYRQVQLLIDDKPYPARAIP